MTHRVEGTFEDRRRLTRAVRQLAEHGVPADTIRVYIVDAQGTRQREVEVEDEAGTRTGALIGAVVGAAIGLILAIPFSAGVSGEPAAEIGGLRALAGGVWLAMVLAVIGAPLGALLGMGRWQGRKRISSQELQGQSARLVVESEGLAKVAREVMAAAGATRVTGSGSG